MQRPVRCWICRRKMYYMGNKKWEPEYRIVVEEDLKPANLYYVHQKCWILKAFVGDVLEDTVEEEWTDD